MPNIIEQQDLLKGLPDNRLAMLLQNPVADIPPFLVAAEAQRRQAIRQQFAGSENKESVVDSLTKQLVPQNIKAQPEMTPPVPATPEMQGVAALQQQQMMQQAAQQPNQGMAGGGPVRRFAAQGYVAPSVVSMANQLTGGAQVGATEDELTFWDRVKRGMGYTSDIIGDPLGWRERTSGKSTSEILGLDPESIAIARRQELDKTDPARIAERQAAAYTGAYDKGYRGIGVMPGARTSSENAEMMRQKQVYGKYAASRQQEPKQEGESEENYRKRLEALFGNTEPSSWEKSQRWFAMAEQFLDPSKTTLESVAGAGRAFADVSAEQAAAARAAELEKQKALLEYDINERDYGRKTAAQRAQDQVESMKYQGEQAMKLAEQQDRIVLAAERELADYQKAIIQSGLSEQADIDKDPKVVALKKRIEEANRVKNAALSQSAYFTRMYGETYGTYGKVPYWYDEKIVYPE